MWKQVAELVRYRELAQHLVTLELKVRYRKSFFGFLWTLMNPLLLMIVLSAVFSRVAKIDEKSYSLFILSGLMIWIFFQQAIDQGLNSIIKHKGLIQKIYVPKLVFPFAIVASNVVNLFFFLVAYFIFALFTDVGWVPTAPLIVPVVLMLFILGIGFSLALSSLNVFFRDFSHLSGVLLRVMFYCTPVIYRPDMLGPNTEGILKLNPVYYPVMAARDVLYYGVMPSASLWMTGFAAALGVLVLGLFVFTRVQDKFVYYA